MLTIALLLYTLLVLSWHTCNGVFISPIAYTLTDVESVSRSSANGGCPQECEGMASGVRRCDCRNSSANITGVLIDGMVPTIDTSMRGTLAAELYTVETTMTTLLMGFLFQSSVMLHEVELYVFYCPAWDIGAATISVYNGMAFPMFIRIGASAESVGSVTLTSDMQNCEDLTRVSIPLQMATSTSSYFIEFTNPTTPQQLYIAEVRFSDQPIPPPTEPAITSSPTTTQASDLFTTDSPTTVATELFSKLNVTTVPSSQPTPSIISTLVPIRTTTSFIINVTTAMPTITMATLSITMSAPTANTTSPPINNDSSSFPVSAIAGGAVGGVLVLSLLVVIACAVILSYRKKEKRKKNHSSKETQLEMETKKNEAYFNVESGVIKDSHHQHSDNTTQDTPAENTEGGPDSSHQPESPCVPSSLPPEDKNTTSTTTAASGDDNPGTVIPHTVIISSGDLSEAEKPQQKEKCEGENREEKNPTTKNSDIERASEDPVSAKNNLDSAEAAKKNMEKKDDNKVVEKLVLENIYTVVKKAKALKGNEDSSDKADTPREAPEDLVYAPIYDIPVIDIESLKLPKLTLDNIKKVKTIGSGQFGKVILADTVDLSPKDLGLSDTDDDKSKSTCVAVKTLKKNPTASMKEVFEKELKFMSCLKHPNIIRTLGACMTVNTPFVVMEYMEKGDLNQYLLEFDGITHGNSPPENLTISTGTLTNMSAQIASAMAYLAHRNFIHRDLATRNCLVGPDLEIKIADFGMSRNLYKSQYYLIHGNVVLPVRWMARECFYGKFSSKSDVWSFGVTMWEMFTLTKDIPYEDMDDEEVVFDATKESQSRKLLERPKDCPKKVYDIMLMCWAEDPHERATFEKLFEVLSSVSLDADAKENNK